MTKPESPKTQTTQDHGSIASLLLHIKSFHVKVLMNNEFRALGELNYPYIQISIEMKFLQKKVCIHPFV